MRTDITKILTTIPKLPGIYIMKDCRGEILYIGKAKSLKIRENDVAENGIPRGMGSGFLGECPPKI